MPDFVDIGVPYLPLPQPMKLREIRVNTVDAGLDAVQRGFDVGTPALERRRRRLERADASTRGRLNRLHSLEGRELKFLHTRMEAGLDLRRHGRQAFRRRS